MRLEFFRNAEDTMNQAGYPASVLLQIGEEESYQGTYLSEHKMF
jgi:hypothetical protein